MKPLLGSSGGTTNVIVFQKGKVIKAGSFTFTNSKTNNVGKVVGPK